MNMSSKNLGKPLTKDLIFTKTKSDSLQNIKNLNLWGNDLQDLKLIQNMPNLEVVSLSVNRISSLRDFSTCNKLQELYLRKNNITDLREIKHLLKLPHLKVLWLYDNPCAQIDNYREIVIKSLPNLMKLDNNLITQQQRNAAQGVHFTFQGYNYETQNTNEINYGDSKYHNNNSHVHNIQSENFNSNQNNYPQQKYTKKPQSSYGYQKSTSYDQKPFKQIPNKPSYGQQKLIKNKNSSSVAPSPQISRNQNILMAVLSLMRQLDQGSLQIIKRQADKLMSQ